MAKKRTRKQKQQTASKRQQQTASPQGTPFTYQLTDYSLDEKADTASVSKTKTRLNQVDIQYSYDPNLILADLKKTLFLSAGIFGVLIGIYYASLQNYFGLLG